MSQAPAAQSAATIRPMREEDVEAADRIMRVAFGTFLRMPEPEAFMGDAGYVRHRRVIDPESAFVAELDGEVVGSNFATGWGTFGFFGPLSVRPDLWNGGIAKRLLEPVMERFESWDLTHAGLFTFSYSAKHLALYQKFGFHPRFLTVLMTKGVGAAAGDPAAAERLRESCFSALGEGERADALAGCRAVADQLHGGLDISIEIEGIRRLGLGETILLREGSKVVGFAVCHCGAGTEAGGGGCYVKFGAVQPGPGGEERFARLLDLVECYAATADAKRIIAGVNTAREEAYRVLLERGFRIEITGIAMHRPNEPGFCRKGAFVLDDWR